MAHGGALVHIYLFCVILEFIIKLACIALKNSRPENPVFSLALLSKAM